MLAFDVSPGVGRVFGPVIAIGTAEPGQLSALELDVVVEVVAVREHARALGTGELTRFCRPHATRLPWLLLLWEGYYLDASWPG